MDNTSEEEATNDKAELVCIHKNFILPNVVETTSYDKSGNSHIVDFHKEPSKIIEIAEITIADSILKSSTAKMISKVITTTKELLNFDKHHLNYKKSHSEESRKNCRNLLPQLQVSVLKEHGRKNGQITKWVKQFYLQNDREPKSTDYENDPDVYKDYIKLSIAKKLLHLWNIKF